MSPGETIVWACILIALPTIGFCYVRREWLLAGFVFLAAYGISMAVDGFRHLIFLLSSVG